jgi:hypothetical protein
LKVRQLLLIVSVNITLARPDYYGFVLEYDSYFSNDGDSYVVASMARDMNADSP